MKPLDRDRETQRLLDLLGQEGFGRIHDLINGQFALLHNRAQVLLGLCGAVITVTGFSGRVIAGTNRPAQALIVTGLGLVLLAALVVVQGVLHLRWLTQQPGDDLHTWLQTSLRYRDRKTTCYRRSIYLLLVGLALYVTALALMLLYPHVGAGLPAR